MGVLRRGGGDPAFARDASGAVWRATRTPGGIATIRLTRSRRPTDYGARPGARAPPSAVEQAPELLGDLDDPSDFDPAALPLLDEAHRGNPGLRIACSAQVFEALAAAILEQKVITLQAHDSWRRLVTKFGTVAPGPTPRPMRVAPSADAVAGPSRAGNGIARVSIRGGRAHCRTRPRMPACLERRQR